MDSQLEPNSYAEKTARLAHLEGERGLAVSEGFASARADFLEAIDADVPGAEALANRGRRVVLVTDRHVHLFQGKAYDAPGDELGVYPVDAETLAYDGRKLSFPDGQRVFMGEVAAKHLGRAVGIDIYAGLAARLLARLGVTAERAVAAEPGTVPRKKTFGSRLLDLTIGDGPLDVRKEGEGRIVLVTDEKIRIVSGQMSKPGHVIATFPTAPDALACESGRLTCPDGTVISMGRPDDATHIMHAIGNR